MPPSSCGMRNGDLAFEIEMILAADRRTMPRSRCGRRASLRAAGRAPARSRRQHVALRPRAPRECPEWRAAARIRLRARARGLARRAVASRRRRRTAAARRTARRRRRKSDHRAPRCRSCSRPEHRRPRDRRHTRASAHRGQHPASERARARCGLMPKRGMQSIGRQRRCRPRTERAPLTCRWRAVVASAECHRTAARHRAADIGRTRGQRPSAPLLPRIKAPQQIARRLQAIGAAGAQIASSGLKSLASAAAAALDASCDSTACAGERALGRPSPGAAIAGHAAKRDPRRWRTSDRSRRSTREGRADRGDVLVEALRDLVARHAAGRRGAAESSPPMTNSPAARSLRW